MIIYIYTYNEFTDLEVTDTNKYVCSMYFHEFPHIHTYTFYLTVVG